MKKAGIACADERVATVVRAADEAQSGLDEVPGQNGNPDVARPLMRECRFPLDHDGTNGFI